MYRKLNGRVDVNQTFMFPHLTFGADHSALAGVSDTLSPFALQYVENFVLSTTGCDYHDFSYSIVQLAHQIDPGQAHTAFDVKAFRARRGKLLQYYGLADQLIATGPSIHYYSQVQQRLASQARSLDD